MFEIKVTKPVAVISENSRNGKTLELNRVQINDSPVEQWDLRRWQIDRVTGEKQRMAGVCFHDDEMEELKKVLCDL